MTRKVPSKDKIDILKTLYSEASSQFRFFLTWRQLLLAGYLGIYAALALSFRWALLNFQAYAFVTPFLGALLSILFWALDFRNRQVYQIASQSARAIENELGYPDIGYYSLFKSIIPSKSFTKHQTILTILYLGGGALALVIGILCIAANLKLISISIEAV
jgi:hypothetical protein